VITVVDRGFSSDANLAYLTRAGGHWIAGERMRDGAKDAAAALSRQGRYQQVRDNLRVKDVRIGEGDATKRFIVCHNPAEAERQKTLRDATITRLAAELERLGAEQVRLAATAATKTPAGERATNKLAEAHTRAECALRDHPALGRYLRQTATGRLVIDRAKITAEERLDGKYLLSTSDPTLSAEDVALGYKNLLEAERGFRDLKGVLELRPVFHRLEHRIRAHVTLCWLALLMIRVVERQTTQTWRTLSRELNRLHLVTLEGAAGSVTQTTTLSDAQRVIYTACETAPPPPITALSPA
jgi:transposase